MNIYSEIILDHYENPQNWGTLESSDISVSANNPLCGDIVHLKVKLDRDKIVDLRFIAQGCAISIAASSLLSEEVKGKTTKQVLKMGKDDIIKLVGIELSPSRLKCGLLALEGLKDGITKHKS